MRILICTWNIPGYAPNELFDYLRAEDYHVQKISAPAKHERRFIPGVSHFQNMKQIVEEAYGYYDIAIAPDPAYVYALDHLKRKGQVGKVIYWRLDYFPKKYPEPFNQAYQFVERHALSSPDEIWSIADPEIPLISESLGEANFKTILVPYLLPKVVKGNNDERKTAAMWMGPDLDESRPLCIQAAAQLANAFPFEFDIADYSIDQYRVDDDKLAFMLGRAKVGLSPYQPEEFPGRTQSKYFCDASRVRRFLSFGVPVVTTDVAPTHTTLVQEKCGYICDWTAESIEEGIRYCLENFDELSENAIKAANKYTYGNWFTEHKVLDPHRLGLDLL